MKVFIENHAICFHLGDTIFLVRPALCRDGRTGRPGKTPMPWFKVETWKGNLTIWRFFTVPFMAFGLINKIAPPPSNEVPE